MLVKELREMLEDMPGEMNVHLLDGKGISSAKHILKMNLVGVEQYCELITYYEVHTENMLDTKIERETGFKNRDELISAYKNLLNEKVDSIDELINKYTWPASKNIDEIRNEVCELLHRGQSRDLDAEIVNRYNNTLWEGEAKPFLDKTKENLSNFFWDDHVREQIGKYVWPPLWDEEEEELHRRIKERCAAEGTGRIDKIVMDINAEYWNDHKHLGGGTK